MESLAKSIIVTGASRGLGLELVRQIAQLSSPPEVLVATCRDPQNALMLQQIAKWKPFVKVMKMDVENDDEIDAVVEEMTSLVGESGLNLLINNAAIYLPTARGQGKLRMQSRDLMQKHFNINTTAPVILTQKFLPLLEMAASRDATAPMGCSRAACVIISGRLGSQTTSYQGLHGSNLAYKCSKNAVNMATILMSRELKDVGVLVAAIHPGSIKSDMGGPQADLSVEDGAEGTLKALVGLEEKDMGLVISYEGGAMAF